MAEVLNTGANTPETTAAPAGHDAAMAAKADAAEASLQQVGQDAPKDEGQKILGKFNSYDDLEKAYKELERKMSQPQQQQRQPQDTANLNEDSASELIEKAGIDVDVMADHYYENGGLAEEHYNALEQAGVPREYVDQYLAGVEAEAERMRDDIFNEVGGQEAFAAMAEWANANLSEAELDAYNEAVDSGDMSVVRSAVMSLAFRYQRDMGRDPNLVGGASGGLTGFESLAQLTAAMKDPRYETDPAYRREIEQKLARSNIM